VCVCVCVRVCVCVGMTPARSLQLPAHHKQRLALHPRAPTRLTSALLQPVLDPSTDGCMAVLVALNKLEAEVADGAFDDASFSRSDRCVFLFGARVVLAFWCGAAAAADVQSQLCASTVSSRG